MEKTYEVCPHCGEEVQLDAELKVQVCPNCGKHLVSCSMCPASSGEVPDYMRFCQNCILEYLEKQKNNG